MLESRGVAIITDSSACLPEELIRKYGIEIVPMEFSLDGKIYRDGVDISPLNFYKLLSQLKETPTTSAPPPITYYEVFRKVAKRTQHVLAVSVTSKFSHAFDSARAGSEMAKKEFPGITLKVLDCGTAAGAQGLLVMAAARAAASGESLSRIIEIARALMPRVHLVAFIDTLYYLAKGGRVPEVAAWASSLLKIKPVVELLPLGEGVVSVGRVRARSRATERLVEVLRERTSNKPIHVMVMHTNVLMEAERLKEWIASEFNCLENYVVDFTPVMGCHTGPGLLGIAFYTDN